MGRFHWAMAGPGGSFEKRKEHIEGGGLSDAAAAGPAQGTQDPDRKSQWGLLCGDRFDCGEGNSP